MSLRKIALDGAWNYEPVAHVTLKPGAEWVEDKTALPPAGTMAIPNNWQLGGLDDFHGRVRFSRIFAFDGRQAGEASVWLHFEAVDYFCRVWLNEAELGGHTGYFAPFEFDVTALVQQGENRLVVEVSDPLEEPGTVWPDHKLVIKGILSHWDCRPGSWDLETGQAKNSGGIWRSVYLETRPSATIGHVRTAVRLAPRSAPPGFADHAQVTAGEPYQALVVVDVEIHAPAGEYRLRAAVGVSATTEKSVRVTQPGERHSLVVQVMEPKLWWTWDRGEPHLESCVVTLMAADGAADERTLEIGLRELRVDPKTGTWWLNGARVFVRGANVVPTLWLAEYDAAMIGADIELLKAAHINGVRVCVHINREEFYSACDHAGILVWQDFALQWGYEETQTVMQEAVAQIREMVRMLVNHPSIAVWSCQNESTFHNKFIMDPVLEAAVALEDGSRYIRATSEFAEHFYGGWYYGHYRDYLTLKGTPILTEFGAQALPRVEQARAMGGDVWPPDWAALAYHDFQYDQTFHVAGVEMGDSWEEFVANSQSYQARVLKFAIERYRKAKYEKLGAMFEFMFMDCWPSVTWSVVEYDRTPKPGYQALQQVYQPILIGADLARETLLIGADRGSHERPLTLVPWVVNDQSQALEGCTYRLSLEGEGFRQEWDAAEPFTVPADGFLAAAPPITVRAAATPGAYVLSLTLICGGKVVSVNTYNVEVRTSPGQQGARRCLKTALLTSAMPHP